MDSDKIVTKDTSFRYKIWVNWELKTSSLQTSEWENSSWWWCYKHGIYISEDTTKITTWYTWRDYAGCSKGNSFVASDGWFIYTKNVNWFWVEGRNSYTNKIWNEFVR
jgi:hypothetical protein